MALDLHLSALQFDQQLLVGAIDEVQNKGWKVIVGEDRALTLVKCPPAVQRVAPTSSIYEELERHGVLCIAGRPAGCSLLLSGGSTSVCSLVLSDPPTVIKSVGASVLEDRDVRDRHREEARWTASAALAHPDIFPSIHQVDDGAELVIRSAFFPAYTLGELLLQGRVDFNAASRILRNVFASIGRNLSSVSVADPGESYLDKAERRLVLLQTIKPRSPAFEALCLSECKIDGVECHSAFKTLEVIRMNRELNSFLECHVPCGCHGDLIPEDILYSIRLNQFRLIDPNPQIRDPLCDIAKVVMSLSLSYELALADMVSCKCIMSTKGAEFHTYVGSGFSNYQAQVRALLCELMADIQTLLPAGTVEDHRLKIEGIMLLAGVQAMALPPFHALHHGKPARATFFLARGLLMANQAIASLRI